MERPDEDAPPEEPDGMDEGELEPEPELPEGILDLLPPLDPDEPLEEEEGDEDGEPGEEGMLEDDCWLTQPPTRNVATELTTAA